MGKTAKANESTAHGPEASRLQAFMEGLAESAFWQRYPWPFVVAFAVCAGLTIYVHYTNTFWPGQDDNYDKYCAMVVSRMGGDPAIGALYEPLKPWHSHTLLYFLAGNLGRVMEPTAAFRVVYVACAFIGTPLVSAWVLTEEKRSPWGALAAFPFAYGRAWSFGFLRYSMAAPFFLLTLFTFAALFRAEKLSRGRAAAYFVSLWLLWMSHSQVFASGGALLGALWVGFLADRLVRALSCPRPHLSLRTFAIRTGIALALSLPALYCFLHWYEDSQTTLGVLSSKESWKDGLLDTLDEKFRAMLLLLVITKAPNEYEQVVLLVAVALGCGALRKLGSKDLGPVPEVLFALTFLMYFVLPREMAGQLIGPRHIDMALWLLPLCITPALFSRHKLASVLGVYMLLFYTRARLGVLWTQLRGLNDGDLRALEQLVPQAPDGHLKITQVTFGEQYSKQWLGFTFEQNYAYLAARKGYEAPVYDTRYRVAEIRYKDKPPAPPTIMVNDANWWRRQDVFSNFDLVLSFRFHPTTEVRNAIDPVAHSVAKSGEWELWQRR